MPRAPTVSVVSVVRDLVEQGRESSFARMVDSVHRQSHPYIEHVIVDGGSKDGTVDLIRHCAGRSAFTIWISEPDRGIYDAMNKGAELASGKYVVWLNSDDYYHDASGVEKVASALADSNADYSYARMRYVEIDGTLWACKRPKLKRFLHMMPFPHPTFFVRRSVFETLGAYDPRLQSAADYGLVLRLLLNRGHRGVYVDHAFATFQGGGASSDYWRDRRERASLYASSLAPFGKVSQTEWLHCITRGRLPMKVLLGVVGSPSTSFLAKRAAVFEMRRAIRRKMKGDRPSRLSL